MGLKTLSANCTRETLLAAMAADGAVIIADVLPRQKVDALCDELMPYVERSPKGRDDFTGHETRRTGALVARAPQVRDVIVNELILGGARNFLAPFTERIVLHLTQSIHIYPGQGAQVLHRDRLAWGTHLPTSIEPQFNTMWALTEFTAENGATRLVPGSHTWDWARRAEREQFCQAEMSRGSVLCYSGSVLHSGGENHSAAARLGLNITYCLGWLRQEENQYLSCPPHIAKDLDPELQELLGYTQGNYALGYYSDPDVAGEVSDLLPPEMALGRMPRKDADFSLDGEIGAGVSAEFREALTAQE
jgi:hypothetical protein